MGPTTPRAARCGPVCRCSTRPRLVIALRVRPESLPTNPLRCCNLFLARGGNAETFRKIKAFDTEITEECRRRQDPKETSRVSRKNFRILASEMVPAGL